MHDDHTTPAARAARPRPVLVAHPRAVARCLTLAGAAMGAGRPELFAVAMRHARRLRALERAAERRPRGTP